MFCSFLRLGNVFPLYSDFLEDVADFAKVIAVASHPVKALHILQELFPVTLDCTIKL